MSSKFDYSLDFEKTNFREHPELYKIGRGEQGVLMVQPYKSELLPLWRFKTLAIAKNSAEQLYQKFLDYKKNDDFVGMDMARKYIQMGYTRSRRYANHPSGKKYQDKPASINTKTKPANVSWSVKNKEHYTKSQTHDVIPQAKDALTSEKAQCAQVFQKHLKLVNNDSDYLDAKKKHRESFES